MSHLVLGSRGSALALWQAHHVAGRLEQMHAGLRVEIRRIRTKGDRITDVPFGGIAGKGFFVKEIEDALLARRIHLAVHSLKDLPSELPPGLSIAAVLERHDPRDALVSRASWSLEDVPSGATLATGSLRRRCQLLHARPDLRVVDVRGNVDTRIRKLEEERFDALILALAGIERLDIRRVPVQPLPPSVCLPAVGQGALAVETREDDAATRRLLRPLDHAPSRRAVTAERGFLARLGGGCLAPATAFARLEDERLTVEAMVGDADGRRLLRDREEGGAGGESEAGVRLAVRLLQAGGDAILRSSREVGGHAAD